jgi:aminoglycoside N3'-acetyltransferase
MYDKKDWQAALMHCGIQKGENLIISGSLSYEDKTIDGWPTLVEACLSMVGVEGSIMTIVKNPRSEPCHLDRTISSSHRQKLIKQWSHSSYTLTLAHPLEAAFIMHDEVRRIVHPGYRFYAIGKYAPFMVRKVSKHFPLHEDGPLQAAVKLKAKLIHFGDDEPWVMINAFADEVIVNGGINHLDGIAKWETFLDKEGQTPPLFKNAWKILDEKVRLYEFN